MIGNRIGSTSPKEALNKYSKKPMVTIIVRIPARTRTPNQPVAAGFCFSSAVPARNAIKPG